MTVVPAEFVTLAERLADAARPVVRKYFRTPVAVDDKADDSPVTIADREVEAAMRAILAAEVPGHGILGEEHGRTNCEAEWVWVLDPIDGTAAFITGKPSFGTLIALAHRGVPVLGIIDQAFTSERWLGVAGRPTTLNGVKANVRACPDLAHAYAYTTAPELFCAQTRPAWDRIAAQVKRSRYGCDCYAYALAASGFVDLVVEAGLAVCWRCQQAISPWEPWDLGHVPGDRSRYAGPEHRKCNRTTSPGPVQRRVSRAW